MIDLLASSSLQHHITKIFKKGCLYVMISNWSNTFSCAPEAIYKPTTEQEIQALLTQKVRVIGSLHSPSDIAFSKRLISLENFNKILSINPDEHGAEVLVQAGIKLHKLNQELDKQGFALSSLGSISDQSLAGAISTGTHGTGFNFGPISSSVTSIKLLTQSRKRTLKDKEFRAALCGLGCLGVIIEVSLRVEKKFNLAVEEYRLSYDYLINNLRELVHSGEHVRFWLFPHSGAYMWRANRTTQAPRRPPPTTTFYSKHLLEVLLYLELPDQLLNNIYYNYLCARHPEYPDNPKISFIDISYKAFNFDCLFKQHVTEWCIPLDSTAYVLKQIPSIFKDVKAHFPIEIRFVKSDNSLISPTSSETVDVWCYIGIIQYRPFGRDFPKDVYWSRFENLMYSNGGRPHWAKFHKLSLEELRKLYPNMDEFLAIKQRLDPNGLFDNEYTHRHLSSL